MQKVVTLLFLFIIIGAQAQNSFLSESGNLNFEEKANKSNTFFSDNLYNDFDSIILDFAEEKKLVGFSVAIDFGGGEVYTGVNGKASSSEHINYEHYFQVGSVTKTIVASSILLLQEQGKLKLTDPIKNYITPIDNIDSTITIKQCLNHTSGIYDYTKNPAFIDSVKNDFSKIFVPNEILDFVKEPNFSPGLSWSYSNTNYVLLGMIIEAVEEKPIYEVIREQILVPHGLEALVLPPFEDFPGTLANLYLDLLGTGFLINWQEANISTNGLFSGAWAAGAYAATPSDIAKWMRLLNTGSILSPASYEEMTQTVLTGQNNFEYGLGLSHDFFGNDLELWGHSGNIIYQSEVWYSPDIDISIAICTNDGDKTETLPILLERLLIRYLQFTASTYEIEHTPLQLFPNPSSTFVSNNDITNLKNIQITNMLGQHQVVKLSGSTIDIQSFTPGLYFLTGKNKANTYLGKFIKE